MVSEPKAAVLYPDEYTYHIRGTYWRVVYGDKRFRSQLSTRGWTKPEALEIARQLSPVVRIDRRTLNERHRAHTRKKRTHNPETPKVPE